jgi:hypothetical protein
VEWKAAIQCAVLVAGIAAVLSLASGRVLFLGLLSWLWMISGSIITLALYQRRRPLAWMDAGVGARIGLVVGLALVVFLAVTWGVAGLVARYVLHNLGTLDAQWTEALRVQLEKSAAIAQQPPESMKFMLSPEYRAGVMLAMLGLVSGGLLLLSTVGGAVGGFMRMRRKLPV